MFPTMDKVAIALKWLAGLLKDRNIPYHNSVTGQYAGIEVSLILIEELMIYKKIHYEGRFMVGPDVYFCSDFGYWNTGSLLWMTRAIWIKIKKPGFLLPAPFMHQSMMSETERHQIFHRVLSAL